MKLTLNPKDYLSFETFILGESSFALFNKDKYIMFHGSKDGSIDIGLFIVFTFFTLLRYKTFCCYPKQMKKSLKIGNFMFENCSTVIDIQSQRYECFGELIILGDGKMFPSGKLNLKKNNRN